MKGTIRLALLSYIAVVAGCEPALALQQPGVVPGRLVSLSSVAAEFPGHQPVNLASAGAAHEAAVALPRASAATADSLAVAVAGPSNVQSVSAPSYRATVVNGRSSSRYYFWWFAANCARRLGCAPSSYSLIAEGAGRDSVTLPISASSVERNLVVQAAELDGPARTGSSPMFAVAGPARQASAPSSSSRTTCDWFAGSFYPHTGEYTDPFTGRTWTRKFRRDYCGNGVSWDPEG